ncbi:MAG: chemotaxis protein CheB [Gemmatimonadaceae bacterium]
MAEPAKRRSGTKHKAAPARASDARASDARAAGAPCPIVGIGASAGGLEALEAFLSHVPIDSGLAYVVIQHMDPTHKGMLTDLLQRVTSIPVTQVTDGIQLRPNCAYVIPPNTDLSLESGTLRLSAPTAERGLRLPIDHFFASLAARTSPPGIGVILSGMGSDGTVGLGAIKASGGATFVQDPASARFDGMPSSAIAAKVADKVAPADALPSLIIAGVRAAPRGKSSADASSAAALAAPATPSETPGDLAAVFDLLLARTGRDFSQYKPNTVNRRLERRMSLRQIDKLATYVGYLRENPQEIDLLFKELLIGVTSFFRDPAEWESLQEAIADSLTSRAPSQTLRAWVAGCSTGEEAYSMAIVCREALEAKSPSKSPAVQIFATDLDPDTINRARGGVYPASIAADISPERLKRFFVESERGYTVSKSIRETVIFAPHDVTQDPPFTKLDVVSCRNVLIYLTPKTQRRLFPVFHYALKPGGLLFLGTSENVGKPGAPFAPLKGKSRLFRRLDPAPGAARVFLEARAQRPAAAAASTVSGAAGVSGASVGNAAPAASSVGLQAEAERLLLRQFAPAAVLVNDKGDILFVSGRTGKYLEPAAGKANWNLFAMAREGLRQELGAGFRKALRVQGSVTRRQVKVESARGDHAVDVTVQFITDEGALQGLLAVVFRDAAMPRAKAAASRAGSPVTAARVAELTQELAQAHRDVRASREHMQASQEELSTVNEELQSSNEELQSTNEELTTSQEEMQSMNEELQTLNQELQARVDNLSHLTNDMKNLLDKTEIATVFLDDKLCVRLFTAGSSRIFPLIASDVGRPIMDFASALHYPALADDAREVLRTLTVHEQPAATRDGGWLLVRIMPYRTLDNTVDGVTITFSDITASRAREDQLRATQVGLHEHIEKQARQIEQSVRQDEASAKASSREAPESGASRPPNTTEGESL